MIELKLSVEASPNKWSGLVMRMGRVKKCDICHIRSWPPPHICQKIYFCQNMVPKNNFLGSKFYPKILFLDPKIPYFGVKKCLVVFWIFNFFHMWQMGITEPLDPDKSDKVWKFNLAWMNFCYLMYMKAKTVWISP